MGCQNSKSEKKNTAQNQNKPKSKVKETGLKLNVEEGNKIQESGSAIGQKTPNQKRYENPQKQDQETASKDNVLKFYTMQGIMGKGSFGEVRLSISKQEESRKFAIKSIGKERMGEKFYMLRRELEILKTLDHPNVIRLYEIFQDEKRYHFVMEYCSGGDIYNHIMTKPENDRKLSEQNTAKIMQKIFSAVAHMHSKGVIHRDLKPENLMFQSKDEDSEIKIIDFGLSRIFEPEQLNALPSVVGTPLYVAPEVIEETYYGQQCDNWSLGVVMYFFLCGKEPFYAQSIGQVYEKIRKADFNFPENSWKHISPEAKDLIKKLLVVDPKKRLTAKKALQHKWLAKFNNQIQFKDYNQEIKDLTKQYILNMFQNKWDQPQFKIQREITKILINHFLTDSQIAEMQQIFKCINTSMDGEVSLTEVLTAMEQLGINQDDQKQKMRQIFTRLHINQIQPVSTKNIVPQDQVLYQTEFMIGIIPIEKYAGDVQKQKNLFNFFDRSQSGNVNIDDLREIVAREGRKLQEQEYNEYFVEIFEGHPGSSMTFEMFQIIINEKDYAQAQSKIKQLQKK